MKRTSLWDYLLIIIIIKYHIIVNDMVRKSVYVRDSELGLFC